MNITFTGEDIFRLAMELEETGEVFYEALALACGNRGVADLCRRLARDEIDHRRKFEQMRERFVQHGPSRKLTAEEQAGMQALINEHVVPSPDEARAMATRGSLADALEMAVTMEENSVEFYAGILAKIDQQDRAALDEIIREEENHKRYLLEARRGL